MTPAHSVLGASSMYRWSVCPGSVRESAGKASPHSAYADEGTAAHALAARWLTTGEPRIPDDATRAAVRVYVEWVQQQVRPPQCTEGDLLFVEHRFDLSAVHPGCFGTADAVIWKPQQRRLVVVDLKFGQGIYVSPVNNPQLNYYALGVLVDPPDPSIKNVKTVDLVIIQPRYDAVEGPIRVHTMAALDLYDFRVDLQDFARATEDPGAPLVPGEHCRFCPAAPTPCVGLHAKAQAVAKLEFRSDLTYDPVKLKLALDSLPALKAFIKAVDEFAYAEAEAGRCAPGYKLVEKRATRKWRNEDDAEAALTQLGITPSVLYEPRTLKSPAALEKSGVKAAVWSDLCAKVSNGHTLVSERDTRPAVKVSAAQEFAVIEGTAIGQGDLFA